MASTIQRSSTLFKQAWAVVRNHPALLVFPVFSAAASLAILAAFAAPFVQSEDGISALLGYFRSTAKDDAEPTSKLIGYLILFGYFFVTTMVATCFNAALLGAADLALRGEPTSVGAGIRVAANRFPQILAWCVVNGLFGLLLALIERRVPLLGKIAVRLVGMAWGIACFFVLPVLVLEGVGPLTAVQRSASALKRTWGETLVFAVGFGAVDAIVTVAFIVLTLGGIVTAVLAQSWWIGGSVIGLGVGVMLAWMTVTSAMRSVMNLALYRYATAGAAPEGFTLDALKSAFHAKN